MSSGAAALECRAGPGAAGSILDERYDVVVIGGGIAGAGIMREAARHGLRVLLVEQNDYASGASSRSSKLVHGGLQYLARLELGLAWDATRDRDRIVLSGAGLVEPLRFMMPAWRGRSGRQPASWQGVALLTAYELLCGRLRVPPRLDPRERAACGVGADDVFTYREATTDDARLVLSVLRSGISAGGRARNYVACTALLRDGTGRVCGVRLRDRTTGSVTVVGADVVINAAGAWADRLPAVAGSRRRVRAVRGSHLVVPHSRLPLRHAVVACHPRTGEPLYCIPWHGVTLVGSTSVEHADSLDGTPRMSPDEATLLLEGVNVLFPSLRLEAGAVQATFAGVRPIADCGTTDPRRASRELAITDENGLITVVGGKLTTFHSAACRVMERIRLRFPALRPQAAPSAALDALPELPSSMGFTPAVATRLAARYGLEGLRAIAAMPAGDRSVMRGTDTLHGELRWACRNESVHHLDDLLLRRVRLGLTVPAGGRALLPRLRPVLQQELGWDATRCRIEEQTYLAAWQRDHGVPGRQPAAVRMRSSA
jgi:glycerol-3-phosphate dehydrogenase